MLISLEQKENLIESVYDSSNILASKYIPDAEILYIIFKKNNVYSYTPVSEELFQQFQLSDSQGKFFIDKIKKNEAITCIKEQPIITEEYALLEQKTIKDSDNA